MKTILSAVAVLMLVCGTLTAQNAVTFNHDIAPIVYRSCAPCHRPGEAAPFALLSYSNVLRKASTIAKVTASRQMPPWQPEPVSYPYRDERRLPDAEVALIQAWVKQGMPEGSAADKVEVPKFSSGWRLGEPDLVVEMPEAYHMPADGPDIYRNLAVPLGITEDKWLAAIDIQPSARAVVHHVLYFADATGAAHARPKQGTEPGYSGMPAGASISALGGWAVGAQPHFFPDGLALKLPKGSDLVVEYHFHPTGKPEAEKSRFGLYFAKQPPTRTLTRIQMPPSYSLFSHLDIPAGEKDFVIRDSYTLPAAVDGVGIGAHAHYLAKQMKMTATLPGGEVKTLFYVKDWDFAWQDRYFFKDFVPLPKGTRLDAEIHWDNSADNPRNPLSKPVRVTWGEETKDEMGSISLMAVPHVESDLATLRQDIRRHEQEMARAALREDPSLGAKLREILGGQ